MTKRSSLLVSSSIFVSIITLCAVSLPPSCCSVYAKESSQTTVEKLLETNSPEKALVFLERQKKAQPKRHWPYCRSGDALWRLHREHEAEKSYTEAIKLDPTCYTSRERRAALRFRAGQYDDAAQDLEIIARMRGYRIGEMLAKCYLELGRYEDCIEVCDKSMEPSGDTELSLLKAEALARLGKLDSAYKSQLSAKKFWMNGTIAPQSSFVCEREEGFDEKSLEHRTFNDCAADIHYEIDSNMTYHPALGFLNGGKSNNPLSAGRTKRPFKNTAWAPATLIATSVPNFVFDKEGPRETKEDYLLQAINRFRASRLEDGIEVLRQADIKFPNEHKIFCVLGSAYYWAGENRKAYKAFGRAIELDPKCQTALDRHMKVAQFLGFSLDAIADAAKLSVLRGNDLELLKCKALAEFDIGMHEECVADCSVAIETKEAGLGSVAMLRAKAYERLGKPLLAKRDRDFWRQASYSSFVLSPNYNCDYFKSSNGIDGWHDLSSDLFRLTGPSLVGEKLELKEVEAQVLGAPDEKPDGVAPKHWEFQLKPDIRVYVFSIFDKGVKDFRFAYPPVADAISELRKVLKKKEKSPKNIPFLPWADSSTPVISHVKYLKMRNGEGVRYFAAYGIEPDTITNERLEYVMQGLSKDGQYYISVYAPIRSEALPDRSKVPMMTEKEYAEFSTGFEKYAKSIEKKLNGLDEESFKPSISDFDKMIESIAFYDSF